MDDSKDSSLAAQLYAAAKEGEVARVKELMAAGAGPDQPVTTAGGRETALVGAITAAVADNTAVLAALLAAAPTLDQAAKGEALLAAAKYGRADYMQMLLAAGADPNVREAAYGNTPLMLAALRSCASAVKELIERGADVNAQNRLGDTALHKAAAEPGASTQCVEMLLACPSISLVLANNNGQSALCRAINRGNVDAVRLLVRAVNGLESDLQRRAEIARALLCAAREDQQLPALQAILQDAPPGSVALRDELGNTALHVAGTRSPGNTTSKAAHAQALIEHGADVNATNDDGETPLHTNVQQSASYEFLKCLVDHGADVTARDAAGRSVLHRALLAHSLPALKLLLCGVSNVADTIDAGLELTADSQGDSLLHKLARSEEYAVECLPRVVELLAARGVQSLPWNQQNGQGSTCLHVALRHQNAAAVQYLVALQPGVDIESLDLTTLLTLVERRGMGWMDARVKQTIVDARDQDSGHSLLHKAVVSGSLEGVVLCLELGFDVNQAVASEFVDAYSTGGTPLHLAVEHDHEPIVRHLLTHGAQVNSQEDYHKNAPVHVAAREARISLLRLLLASGADPAITNRHDERAVDLTESPECAALLQTASATRQED
ncbi:ankyrin, putative [Acanthamoeba castellanii str. Neff]|uniref:Ankyrin, putative n=1 Tax=Acanthamoeba castellanii (strain ATCC 30010 / Neff) TaxID=1257118 RepID=L8GFB5_ACACF|nr:ankyrin, putative [Acanthamoeba castellanii str. Neff]ELR11667.1 ankyrin, putative [Acanthamoeba castellanii str. Neff]